MKKTVFVILLVLAGMAVFAGGEVEISSISQDDVKKLDKILQDLEPVYAIKRVLELYPNETYPMYTYFNAQEMKIGALFSKYGIKYSEYTSYKVSDQKIQTMLIDLQGRYTFLDKLKLKSKESLSATLQLLE